jgi:hypothetical protein
LFKRLSKTLGTDTRRGKTTLWIVVVLIVFLFLLRYPPLKQMYEFFVPNTDTTSEMPR